jgi:Flp pilus assembly protein TadG
MMTAWTKFCSTLRAFRVAHAGNVAIIFALASIPVIGFIGAGYDYSHANAVKTDMQAALDSTALMLAKDAATLSPDDLQIKARNYFLALFTRREAKLNSISATYTTQGGAAVTVSGSVDVPTTFIQALDVIGVHALDNITVNGSSTAKWGNTLLRVALALDNTGSMDEHGKMTALKSATKSLLTQLKNAASQNGDVYVSIIPFSKDVNIGSSNKGQSYLDWTDFDENEGSCSKDTWQHQYSKSNCNGYGAVWTATPHSSWNGCITDRGPSNSVGNSTWDQVTTLPDGTADSKWPAEQYNACPVAMKGLSWDWTAMNSLVDSMHSNGMTNQPIGLVWAWQSLVGGGPLTAPVKDSNYTYQEAIILLSDGINTADRWSAKDPNPDQFVDHRMYKPGTGSGTCANIKAAGITIYAIQVNTGSDPISTVMQNCASSSDKFFLVKNASDISGVFNNIGTNLTKLRVAK